MSTTQLDASIGLSTAETTYGTAVTVSKFFEFLDESLDANLTYTEDLGYRVGTRTSRGQRRQLSKFEAGGDIDMVACSKGMGALFKAALGTVTTTQRGSTGVYQQNHTPATADFVSSYTLQKGVPPLGGGSTVAYTFPGAICEGFELACPNGEQATLKTTWKAKDCVSDVGYAAPSYPTGLEVFTFVSGDITIGGSVTMPTTTELGTGGTAVANIRDFTVTYANNTDDDGFNLGSAGRRSRKNALGRAVITGTFTAEFDATTYADAYLNNTSLEVVLTLQGETVIGSGSDVPALQVVLTDVRLNGELPKVPGGGAVITQSVSFEALYDTTNAPITVVYVSTDSAP